MKVLPSAHMKFLKHLIVLGLGILSAMYLLNIGAGVIELIPDNIPIIGNLDEAAAAFLLLNCLAYFGIDLRNIFKPMKAKKDIIDV